MQEANDMGFGVLLVPEMSESETKNQERIKSWLQLHLVQVFASDDFENRRKQSKVRGRQGKLF